MDNMISSAKRILMLNSQCGWFGGVEALMGEMAKSMRAQGWEIYGLFEQGSVEDSFSELFQEVIIAGKQSSAELLAHYQASGIGAIMIHKTTRLDWVECFSKAFPSFLVVHDHDYYCIRRHKYFPYRRKNCYLPFCIPSCSLCSMLFQKKGGAIKLINPFQNRALLYALRKSTYSFVLSEAMRENLLKNAWEAQRIKKLIPYRESRAFDSIDTVKPEVPQILYVGQLIRGKGLDLLLQALAKVDLPCHLQIYGKGNDESYLQDLAKTLMLEDKLSFKGFSLDLQAAYATASLLVVPSRWQEPFALVGLEAFAHKVPVVGFDVGGISEWLKHKVNGLLVKERDTQKLAQAIKKLLQNPELARQYGEAGYQDLQTRYTREAFASSFIPLIENFVGDKAEPQASRFHAGYSLLEKLGLKALSLLFTLLLSLPVALIQLFSAGKAFEYEYKNVFGAGPRAQSLPLIKSKHWLIKRALLFPLALVGKLDLVGSSLQDYRPENEGNPSVAAPGIFSLHFVRSSSKMAMQSSIQNDSEYLEKRSLRFDLGIILKSFVAGLYHLPAAVETEYIELFGLKIVNSSMQEAMDNLHLRLQNGAQTEVFFINADCINKIFIDKEYYDILLANALLYPDGSGINMAARILGNSLQENLNGTDLLPYLCAMAEENGYRIYLLGAADGVAIAAREKLLKRFPKLQIVGAEHGYFNWENEADAVIERINAAQTDILLVAFGAPLQEKFIRRFQPQIKARLLMGVGGLLDFYSEQMPRAPLWMREIGMEWIYRLIQEPRRMWKRYILGNPLFLYRVFKWRNSHTKRIGT